MEQRNDKPEGNTHGADKNLGQSFVTWANAGVLGFHMISGPLLGIFLGYYLDKWLDTSPVCVGIGIALGLVAGALNMYRDIRRILREQEAADAREKLRRLGRQNSAGSPDGGGAKELPAKRSGDSSGNDDDYNDPASGYGQDDEGRG